MLRLATDVERILRIVLHAISQLEGLNAGLELRVLIVALQVPLIQLRKQIELLPLLPRTRTGVADVFDEPVELRVLCVDVCSLIRAGQKAGLPVLCLLDRIAAGAHSDEARQVLILA